MEKEPNVTESPEGSIVISATDVQSMALANMRRAAAPFLGKAVPAAVAKPTQDELGELRRVRISDVVVGPRFRKDLGDLTAFAQSILEVGLLNPILLSPELHLVGGMRRLEAYRLLGRTGIPARVVDIEDESLAAMEEDRSRKPLSPTEKYAATEYLREKIARDPNWRKTAMGGKLNKAFLRGRLEDFLAAHVRISRPTLAKIRTMVQAAERDPARFGPIVEELDRDGKVDKHYKRYQAEALKDDENPRFRMIVLSPSWQSLESKSLRKAMAALTLPRYAEEDAVLLVSSSAKFLPQASALMHLGKFAWQTALFGGEAEGERLWLIGTSGKTFPQDLDLTLVAEACLKSHQDVLDAALLVTDGSFLPIDLAQLAAA